MNSQIRRTILGRKWGYTLTTNLRNHPIPKQNYVSGIWRTSSKTICPVLPFSTTGISHSTSTFTPSFTFPIKIPKGFENFTTKEKNNTNTGKVTEEAGKNESEPKDAEVKKNDSESKGAEEGKNDSKPKGAEEKKNEDTVDDKQKFGSSKNEKDSSSGGGDNGGGGWGNWKEPPISSVVAACISLSLVYGVLRSISNDDSEYEGSSREITWSDFRNYMLEQGDVERIVVTDKNSMARVYLKPGARGLQPKKSRSKFNDGSYSGRRSTNNNNSFADGTVMEMGNDIDISPSATGQRTSIPSNSKQHQLVFQFAIGSVESFERKLDEAQRELGIDQRDFIPVQYASNSSIMSELLGIAPSIFLVGMMALLIRGAAGAAGGGGGKGGMFQMGKSKAKRIKKEDITVTFKDVAGCHEAKKEIMEFVDFLKDSSRFTKLGAKIPKGALLCGPPGTGKTLLAKATAGESDVPFYSVSGSDFIEMFVGVGPSRVRDLFKEARKNTPCIVFIDEIDAIGRKRGQGGVGGNDERENTLNQLLVEMDGFNSSSGIVVLAGTNRADVLDDALTRPGRFDRQVVVDKPDLQGRKEIFLVHLKGLTLDGEAAEFAGRLAGLTPGFAGADIANVCNESAIVAARRKGESVTLDDFEKATDRIVGGLESNKIMSKEEQRIVAHHEAGHAVASWFLEHADPLMKVTIIPRSSGALGYAQYLPKEVSLRSEDQIMDIICMALAGRAAEDTFFGDVTTGASDDLKRVTQMVYSMIQLYGMNTRVGQLAFPKNPDAMFDERPYSNATAEKMDEEAKNIVGAAYQRSLKLMKDKKIEVEKVANLLLMKETITHDDVVDLLGPRPFTGNDAYDEYVSNRPVKKETPVIST